MKEEGTDLTFKQKKKMKTTTKNLLGKEINNKKIKNPYVFFG